MHKYTSELRADELGNDFKMDYAESSRSIDIRVVWVFFEIL
jgi:hypothetical protein